MNTSGNRSSLSRYLVTGQSSACEKLSKVAHVYISVLRRLCHMGQELKASPDHSVRPRLKSK